MRGGAGDAEGDSSGGLRLIAGSYERFLFGFRLHPPPHTVGALQPAACSGGNGGGRENGEEERDQGGRGEGAALQQQFCYGGHTGPIKCVAAAGRVAVSGGADDSVRVYDLSTRTDMGALLHHQAGVSCLALHGSGSRPTHLVAGSEDRTISLWEVATWRHLSSLKGHKAPVNDVAVHPSGRVALSVARDSELRLWNLLQARCSFRTRAPAEPLALTYSPGDAASYAMALRGGKVAVHCSADASLTASLPHDGSCLTLSFLTPHVVVTGGEERAIRVWDVRQALKPAVSVAGAHSSRIRSVLGVLPVGQGGKGADGDEGNELALAGRAGLTAWSGGEAGGDGEGDGGDKGGEEEGAGGGRRKKRGGASSGGEAAAQWSEHVVVSGASDGCIRLWDLRRLSSSPHPHASAPKAPPALPAACLSQVLTNARLTCLALSDLSPHHHAVPRPGGKRPSGEGEGAQPRKKIKGGGHK
ncbi:hypothetical protein CLOM_g12598 [Closterium sp. NIES-68]|nr:hypothetical protein CLOM_g12598 [Closterium sp. NIES-68]GJP60271.1 hypothetical protein CLOP_g17482 [Closterium sp. NIES-67]